MGIHILNMLKQPIENFEGILIDDKGKELSAIQARNEFVKDHNKGYKIFCPCDNRDKDGRCAGHKIEKDET